MGHDFNFEVVPLSEVGDEQVATNQPPTVLVADDEPLIVDSLAAILVGAKLRVVKAYGGPQALELAMRTSPDLLLTDVAMPDLNGIDLAMAVAGMMPRCRVLLFSAHASTLDLTEARNSGFEFPLLAKPIHPKEMLKQVFHCLQGEPARAARRHAAPDTGNRWWSISQVVTG